MIIGSQKIISTVETLLESGGHVNASWASATDLRYRNAQHRHKFFTRSSSNAGPNALPFAALASGCDLAGATEASISARWTCADKGEAAVCEGDADAFDIGLTRCPGPRSGGLGPVEVRPGKDGRGASGPLIACCALAFVFLLLRRGRCLRVAGNVAVRVHACTAAPLSEWWYFVRHWAGCRRCRLPVAGPTGDSSGLCGARYSAQLCSSKSLLYGLTRSLGLRVFSLLTLRSTGS